MTLNSRTHPLHLIPVLLLSLSIFGQTAVPPQPTVNAPDKLTLEQLQKSAKIYFRDTAEFPLIQHTTFSVWDPAGRVRQTKMISTDYVFQGYSRARKTATANVRGNISMWAALRGAKMVKTSLNSVVWTIIPGVMIYSDPGEYALNTPDSTQLNGSVTTKITPVKSCGMLSMNDHSAWYFPDAVCGASEFQLHNDLTFQRFAFESSGLPAPIKIDPFGNCTLQRYSAELEFQKITLTGEKDPFLVPKQVTVTLQTNKGRIVIASMYEPKQ